MLVQRAGLGAQVAARVDEDLRAQALDALGCDGREVPARRVAADGDAARVRAERP